MNKIELRKNAFILANQEGCEKKAKYTECSPIYIASTSNVKDTMALYGDAKKVLAVGSTGAHGFEALLNGAVKVDMFDVNELQKVFYNLMKTGIMYLDYEEFIKHFTWKEQKARFTKVDIGDLLSNEMYDKLVYHLDEDTEYVLSPLYDYFYSPDLIISKLFRFEHPVQTDYLKRFVSLYNEEEFYKLKNMLLNGADINYHIASLTDLDKKMTDSYDAIILDNILQSYKDIPEFDTPYDVNRFIDKRLSKLLDVGGVIQAAYGYEVGTALFKDEFGISYNSEEFGGLTCNFVKDIEKKESILIPLVKKWDTYSCDFIPGVEKFDGRKSDNMVLTYRKK